MANPASEPLFLFAEQLARDRSFRFPHDGTALCDAVRGLLPPPAIERAVAVLRRLPVDEYVARAVLPSEKSDRPGARALVAQLGWPLLREVDQGPLYAAEALVTIDGAERRLGIIAQERGAGHGVWLPRHHRAAAALAREYARHKLPIITLIDTPGAEAGAGANLENQAHSISCLIAEFAQIDVPIVAVVIGNGYSGGAIPLATANLLLAVRDGIFNTIHPRGLASIARRYNFSWQECAHAVGVSAYELCRSGLLDGIVDFVPGETGDALAGFRAALTDAVRVVERDAVDFLRDNPALLDHYGRSVQRYLDPSPELRAVQEASPLARSEDPTCYLNVFGAVYRFRRYLNLRRRIAYTTRERYAPLDHRELPSGDARRRQEEEQAAAFERWLAEPLELRYDATLAAAWRSLVIRRHARGDHRGRFTRLLFGHPRQNYRRALKRLSLHCGFALYNQWKGESPGLFRRLIAHLQDLPPRPAPVDETATLPAVIADPAVRDRFLTECQNLLIFDALYESVMRHLTVIAREALRENVIPAATLGKLLDEVRAETLAAIGKLTGHPAGAAVIEEQFYRWLHYFLAQPQRGRWLAQVQEWKQLAYPRVAPPLFAMVTLIFAQLLPAYEAQRRRGVPYDGRLSPRRLGIPDFWNRLVESYQELLIQEVLTAVKRAAPVTPDRIVAEFGVEFHERYRGLMSADPAGFPGFRLAIEEALAKGTAPCGVVAGVGRLRVGDQTPRVGLLISNLGFQAGAFDMAAAEKFCRLLADCARERLPVVCFISSGGMQTKEGAGALFSMSVINDRLTRFIRDHELPVVCFGFGDCTGGAQAGFVTHPLVQTYYFSGTNMPFAGQVVVPSYLPLRATLANYLSRIEGAMRGLVRHPFAPELEARLRAIDPEIPVATETVGEVLARVLRWELFPAATAPAATATARVRFAPIRRILVHARGCTAVKLVGRARSLGYQVVLPQSDADMQSRAAALLGPDDRLICLGGNTPAESYLNAMSIIRLAEREHADALHPGIGFLSENSEFAARCRRHGLLYIGPGARAMELMGNKANAVATAARLGVPVVPGSDGAVTSAATAAGIAAELGYPVLLKAVYGGGGKGIALVRDEGELRERFPVIAAEARSAFGSGDIYLERYIARMRHVEVQVLRDRHGHTRALGLRDCSVQRQNQKIIEESGSTLLPAELKDRALAAAVALTDGICYLGAGTVEFIFDLERRELYFMEMNTRLQVEHPVTEAVSGVDIVGAQFAVAAGESIADLAVGSDGYAIEARINAERPQREADGGLRFAPCAGRVTACELPEREGITVISAVGSGSVIPPYYDNLIMQVIAHGRDRADAIARLADYLGAIRLEGVPTNLALVRAILQDGVFRGGDYDTGYLPAFFRRLDADALLAETSRRAAVAEAAPDRSRFAIPGSDELKVIAPFTGIFFRAPSPTEPDFVRAGEAVTLDRPLGLIEVMKNYTTLTLGSFNRDGLEIFAPGTDYAVVAVKAASGQAVNAGDLLLVVKPAAPGERGDE